MKQNVSLTVASLLSILFMTLHLTGDIVRGIEPGGLANLVGSTVILVIWLYGTLVLAGRRSGYIIILLGSLLGAGVPVIHMRGAGVGGEFAKSTGAFLFIWLLLALNLTATFSVILSARELWKLRPLNFIPTSAAANLTIKNTGGQTLSLNSISIGGANPHAFALVVANHGLSNCFAGMLLGPKSFCQLAVGLAPGAIPPARATLTFLTNDPVNPKLDVVLTLSP